METWKIIDPQDYNKTIPLYEINERGLVRNIETKRPVIKAKNQDRYFLSSYRISQSYLMDKYFNQSILRV
tara:strand:+ start:144 stop:353 length:210 start_codon:yes stop_codon:yes gene_type:complete